MNAIDAMEVVARPTYWAIRARTKREAWARCPAARRGPKPKAVPKAAVDAYLAGDSVRVAAEAHGVSPWVLKRYLHENRLVVRRPRGPKAKAVPPEAIEQYRAGRPTLEIVREFGTNHRAFYRALKAAGVEKRARARGPADTARAEEFARRYLAGEACEAIARDHGITRERVRQILRKAGIESLGFRPEHRKKAAPLTEAEREALRLYQNGVPAREIAKLTGIAARLLHSTRKRGGVPAKGAGYWLKRPDDAELTAEIARLYTSGMGASEIARELPQIKFPETVYRYLKKAGVTPRYPRGSKRPGK